MDESVTRAVERTVLACRCLDGAAEDLAAFASRGGKLGSADPGALQSEATRVELLAAEIAALATVT
jgi:hypothetical protein